jgi:hypothetical protein
MIILRSKFPYEKQQRGGLLHIRRPGSNKRINYLKINEIYKNNKNKNKGEKTVISAETTLQNKSTKTANVIKSKHLVMSPRGGSKPRHRLG